MSVITSQKARSMIEDPAWNDMVVTFEKKDGTSRRMRVNPSVTKATAEKLFEGRENNDKKVSNKNSHLIHVVDVDLFEDDETPTNRTWRAIDQNRIKQIETASGNVYEVSDAFQFRELEDSDPIFTTEPNYDLFEGGIKPEELLTEDHQIKEVNNAIETVKKFLTQAEEAGVIEIG